MTILLVTVAGMSSRFSASVGREVLKCTYYNEQPTDTMLNMLLEMSGRFDRIILVGGYKFDDLSQYVQSYLKQYGDRIDLIYNPKYQKFGSGYSLYLGMKKALAYSFTSITFVEGDLVFDRQSFNLVMRSSKSVITYNGESISAKKSVVFYFNDKGTLRYLYDVNHGVLQIREPFCEIYNSAQIWKFSDVDHVRKCFDLFQIRQWEKTNLEFIEFYFSSLSREQYDLIRIDPWINCNTVDDYIVAWKLKRTMKKDKEKSK